MFDICSKNINKVIIILKNHLKSRLYVLISKKSNFLKFYEKIFLFLENSYGNNYSLSNEAVDRTSGMERSTENQQLKPCVGSYLC